MSKTENGKKYALIAAICYSTVAIYYIISEIYFALNSQSNSITTQDVINWVILIGFAVVLFMKNKKALLVVTGANTLLNIVNLIQSFSLINLFDFLAYTAFVLIIILAIKSNKAYTKLWFLAAVLKLGNLALWIKLGYDIYKVGWQSSLSNYMKSIVKGLLSRYIHISAFAFIECIALMLSGMWLKCDLSPIDTTQTNEYATFNLQTNGEIQTKARITEDVEKLKMYKELLDSGTITQEEFDQKKKQLLGL